MNLTEFRMRAMNDVHQGLNEITAAGLSQGRLKVKYKAKFHVQLMIFTKATIKKLEFILIVIG